MAVIFEYEANRYAREGNLPLAKTFKSAVARALAVTEEWLGKKPIRHIKNRFPTETKYGCEDYAYFDKYMITVASNLHAAYLLCDDSLPTDFVLDHAPTTFLTTDYFHKVFLKSGGYMAEIDTNADPHYDASGLGRVHREGAPSSICLSVPCPSHPVYTMDIEEPTELSICSGIYENGAWRFATDASVSYEVTELSKDEDTVRATILCLFSEEVCVETQYTVNANGVSLVLNGTGDIACLLPAFSYDGEAYAEINADDHSLTVSYEDWICRYTVDGRIMDSGKIAANRNGHYRVFLATAQNALHVNIEITKASRLQS